MKQALAWILAALPLGTEPLLAQRIEPVNSLGRARSTFELADTDKSSKVTLDELARQKLAIRRSDFDAMDVDKDGAWSRDEFFVYYRHLLVNSGQRAADDLEAEVARIQAVRHAKASAEARRALPPPKISPPAAPNADDGLDAAIGDLEKRAAARQATREDFERVRTALLARAQRDNAANPASIPDLVSKFDAALAALEARAKAGNFSHDDYAALRGMLVVRAREAAQNIAGTAPVAAAGANDAQLDTALDELQKSAEARRATHEDFLRLRAAWSARARGASTDPAVVARDADLDQKFGRALDALERDARDGKFTREQFEEIRSGYIARARFAAGANAAVETPPAPAPVAPAPIPPAPVAPVTAPGPGVKLEVALDDLARKVETHAAAEEDFRRLREAWIAQSRAALTNSDPEAVARQATLEEQFTRALSALEQEARAGKYSREQFQALRESYVARARFAANANATPPVAPHVPAPAPVPGEPADEAARRFDDALSVFEQRVVAHGATREDFQRVYDLLVGRARAAVAAQAGASVPDTDPRLAVLIPRLQGVLARLERTLASDAQRTEDFAFLRDAARGRVRELPAEAPATENTSKPVETAKPLEAPKPAEPARPVETAPTPETRPPGDTARPAERQPPAEGSKPVETPKPTETPKPEERPAPVERVRPTPVPAPEPPPPADTPKPADPPKPGDTPKERERPVTPADPPHRPQRAGR